MSTSGTNEHRVPMEVALMKITNHIEGKNCAHTLMFQNKQKNILRYFSGIKSGCTNMPSGYRRQDFLENKSVTWQLACIKGTC